MLAGPVVIALGSGLYIGGGLGPIPRANQIPPESISRLRITMGQRVATTRAHPTRQSQLARQEKGANVSGIDLIESLGMVTATFSCLSVRTSRLYRAGLVFEEVDTQTFLHAVRGRVDRHQRLLRR